MKKIEIEIPEGKEVQWVGDTLKLVDAKTSITERIKTFEDACNELGNYHPLVQEYWGVVNVNLDITLDLIAYLKLRIITAALNEGWEPRFEEGERRYFPWFYFYTKEQYYKLGDEIKGRCVLRSGNNTVSYSGFVDCNVIDATSRVLSQSGSQLAFKTRELAEYAGKQFIDIYAVFIFERH